MLRKLTCFILSLTFIAAASAQTTDTVYLFSKKEPLLKTDAAVALLNKTFLQRFDNASFVSAMNTIAGVKMDERSPGSYRISIRGNLLRSAFGVRNIKMYLDGVPFTDAGGNTYFNELSVNSIERMEILKGPGGSMYGAGTGGVILLENDAKKKDNSITLTGGSYGLFNADGKYYFGNKLQQSVSFSHQQSQGWRNHTNMRRDVGVYHFSAALGKRNKLSGNILYSNLYYQTPGGLNFIEARDHPRWSRPAAGIFKSAGAQQAAIYLSTIYASVSDEIKFSGHFKNTTGGYFAYTDFKNPTIRNYEQKNEKGTGLRSVFEYKQGKYAAAFGGEYQYLFTNTSVYDNNLGQKAALQYHDKIPVHQVNLFLQGAVELPLQFTLTAGFSFNNFHYGIDRVSVPSFKDAADYKTQFIPRISLMKKINPQATAYLSYSRGYSPPTIDEIHASNGVFNKDLQAEIGLNWEAGLKISSRNKKVFADFVAYSFHLKNTIVVGRDFYNGADAYQNAGRTNQQGIEFSLSGIALEKTKGPVRLVTLSSSVNCMHSLFGNYRQDYADFSNKRLAGTPPFNASVLSDINFAGDIYTNLSYTYMDRIPLNNANNAFANSYNLLYMKAGLRKKISNKIAAEFFASLQHSFNKDYSLGDDLNADGGRYYNPSPVNSMTIGAGLKF